MRQMNTPEGTIGERLRALRGVKSLRAFAGDLGVHFNTVLKFEKGRGTPSNDYLHKVCQVTACDKNWLFFGPDASLSEKSSFQQLARSSNRIPDSDRHVRLVLSVGETLKEKLGGRRDLIRGAGFAETVDMAVGALLVTGFRSDSMPDESSILSALAFVENAGKKVGA